MNLLKRTVSFIAAQPVSEEFLPDPVLEDQKKQIKRARTEILNLKTSFKTYSENVMKMVADSEQIGQMIEDTYVDPKHLEGLNIPQGETGVSEKQLLTAGRLKVAQVFGHAQSALKDSTVVCFESLVEKSDILFADADHWQEHAIIFQEAELTSVDERRVSMLRKQKELETAVENNDNKKISKINFALKTDTLLSVEIIPP